MSVLLTASLSATLPLSAASHVDVVKMRTENRVNPLGIGTSTRITSLKRLVKSKTHKHPI